jgi:predicted RNase H-like nuclease
MAVQDLPSKKSWSGMAIRRLVLADSGVVVPDDLGDAGRVPVDDVLDAAAAAWSAQRFAAADAISLPHPPELGLGDRQVAIWY